MPRTSFIPTSFAFLCRLIWPVTLLLISTGLAVYCICGTNVYNEIWEHGWPYVFLDRYCDGESGRFRLFDGPERYFHPFELFLDVLVVVGVLAALTFGPRWPTRHTPDRHRWNMSLSTFLTVIMGGLLFVVCFGGTRIHYSGGTFGWGETWEHGWPFVFLHRGGFMESTRFSFLENPGWDDPGGFRPWMLLLDVLAFSGLVCFLFFGWRWLSRRQAISNHGWSFSLSSLLVVMTLACLLLGHVGYALACSRTELAAIAQLKKQGYAVEIQYIGPVWLARLLGKTDPYEESIFHGCRSLRVQKWADPETLRISSENLRLLQNLKELDFGSGSFQDEELRLFLRAVHTDQIETIRVVNCGTTGTVFADPKVWPKLHSVAAGNSALNDTGFANLAKIASITWLDVSNTELTKKCIAEAESMPNLRHFTANGCGFEPADCAALTARGVVCEVKP